MSDETLVAPVAAPDASSEIPSVPADQAAPPIEGAPVEPDPSGESDEQKAEKPRQRASERISEIYGRMKNAERARDLALAEVERLRAPVVRADEWDTLSYDQQQAAQMRQAVRAERADELAHEARLRENEAAATRASMFSERLASAKANIPDIESVIHDPSLPVTAVGARFIQESDKGPQVAYWLGTNRAEAARIASLDPYAQAYELGRIEQRVSASSSRKLSAAPAPVPKVGGGGGPGGKSYSSMSVDDMTAYLKSKGVLRG